MKNRMIKPALLLGLTFCTVAIVLFACSKSSGYNSGNNGGGNNSGNKVSIKGFAFTSSGISVSTGTTVTWTNNDATTHTVTADDGSFDSGNIAPGASYSHTFNSIGSFKYHCSIHTSMTGNVTVTY